MKRPRKPKRAPVALEHGLVGIPLTKGYMAVVDVVDAHFARFNWCVLIRPGCQIYAARNIPTPDGPHPQRLVYLHREILGVTDPEIPVDHRDGDGLNGRRQNLRQATRQINARNITLPSNNTSGHLGVQWIPGRCKWRVKVGRQQIGYFNNLEEAVAARLAAERQLWGVHPRRLEAHGVSDPIDLPG